MKALQLLRIGDCADGLLDQLGPPLSRAFHVPWDVLPGALDPTFAFHRERAQYHSSALLAQMHNWYEASSWRILGVTEHDLYIPILTFVFGEAQMAGPCAVVSAHRLAQGFYGLPHDEDLLRDRLLKESVHELGHTLALTHCDDYQCAMAPSHAVEWIDLKDSTLCPACAGKVFEEVRG
jgi:archaemetzincin